MNTFHKIISMSTKENRICKRHYKKIKSIFDSITNSQIYGLLENINDEEGLSLKFKELAVEKDILIFSEDFDGLAKKIYPLLGKLRKFLFIKHPRGGNAKNSSSKGNRFYYMQKNNKKRFIIPYSRGNN